MNNKYAPSFYCCFLFDFFLLFFVFLFGHPLLKNIFFKQLQKCNFRPKQNHVRTFDLTSNQPTKRLKYLEVRPVGGHAGPVGVFPPAEVLVLIDGHHRVVELVVHGTHTKQIQLQTFGCLSALLHQHTMTLI